MQSSKDSHDVVETNSQIDMGVFGLITTQAKQPGGSCCAKSKHGHGSWWEISPAQAVGVAQPILFPTSPCGSIPPFPPHTANIRLTHDLYEEMKTVGDTGLKPSAILEELKKTHTYKTILATISIGISPIILEGK
ncbi:hypothetical protein VP01_4263g1 [Puccinia sorghi]|uniref:Uncharacterized protein n=1 Tax=Puccinia sorghi TaxID=27349 RepID=A0A0L6UQC3_9BASI|nr:hypothetical protein VP01_4263g1 [Puccinia sorghi]